MNKALAVKSILLIIVITFVCWGCGKNAAEIALVQKDVNGAEESDSTVDDTQREEVLPETTPVIEVICNCQCSADGDSQIAQMQPDGVVQQPADDGKVNINTADTAELQTLNGIGASRAQAIISYRESYGLFQSIEEIKNVDGIKDGVYNKIKDEISVGR